MIRLRLRREPDFGSWTYVTIADEDEHEEDEAGLASILVARALAAGILLVEQFDFATRDWEPY